MLVIDADTHILECEHTWDFLEGDDKHFRPRWLPEGWELDGNFLLREDGDPTLSMAIKEMGDPAGRRAGSKRWMSWALMSRFCFRDSS